MTAPALPTGHVVSGRLAALAATPCPVPSPLKPSAGLLALTQLTLSAHSRVLSREPGTTKQSLRRRVSDSKEVRSEANVSGVDPSSQL